MKENNCNSPSVSIVDKVLKHLDKKPKIEKELVKGLISALIVFAISFGVGLGFGAIHLILTYFDK